MPIKIYDTGFKYPNEHAIFVNMEEMDVHMFILSLTGHLDKSLSLPLQFGGYFRREQ